MLAPGAMSEAVAPPFPDAPGGVDPSMAQATYFQMFQYFQQQALRSVGDPTMANAGLGMPQAPLPGMPPFPPVPMEATISVSVEGMKFQYQLTEDDLHKVFNRYGEVKSIQVEEVGSSAAITFHNFSDAQAAMQDLNGKVLNGLDGTLCINWLTTPAPALMYQPPCPGWGFLPQGGPEEWQGTMAEPQIATEAIEVLTPHEPHVKGGRKYTCRFIIGIENDQEFQVARRIIGAKGANMKRIVKQTDAKLRLRGVGSGYFEGAGHKESSEPLQLCVSCTSYEGYQTSVQQVEELLRRIYEEYKEFCREKGRPEVELHIKLFENELVYSSRGRDRLAANAGGGGGLTTPKKEGASAAPGVDEDISPEKQTRRKRRVRTTRNSNGEIDRGEPGPNAPSVEEIEKSIDDRNEARRACNFAEADRIRDTLYSRGIALMDEPGGRGRGAEVTTWRYWLD